MNELDTISEHKVLTNYLNEDSIIVDMGACLGEFSSKLYDRFHCKCILYEPDIRNYRKIAKRFKDFTIFNKAIDINKGISKIYLGTYNTATSMYPSHRGLNGQYLDIETTTIDEELKDIDIVDILKIDIEGKEVEIIPELNYFILQKIKQVVIEFHQQSKIDDYTDKKVDLVRQIFKNCGFKEVSYYQENSNSGYEGCYLNRKLLNEYWSF